MTNAIASRTLLPPTLLNDTLVYLRDRGYQHQFRREATCLYCMELDSLIPPDRFTVDEYHHFEDPGNTDTSRTLYAITSEDGTKGYLVDTCLVYEDNISSEMTEKLRWEYSVSA